MNRELLRKMGFNVEVQRVEDGECATCGGFVDVLKDFKDGLSYEEYKISGMCQRCQDKTFGG